MAGWEPLCPAAQGGAASPPLVHEPELPGFAALAVAWPVEVALDPQPPLLCLRCKTDPAGPNYHNPYFWDIRRESSEGMEWLGTWNCIFSGSEFSNFGA